MSRMNKLYRLIAIFFCFGAPQVGALGNPEFVFSEDGQGGVLFIKALDIEGVKTFENVQLELDFTTSTFTLKKIVAADTTIPDDAIETVTEEGVTIGLRGCKAEDRSVFCYLLFTSHEFDRTIDWCGHSDTNHCGGDNNSISFDNLGNRYWPTKTSLANKTSGRIIQRILADVTVEAIIQYDNFSTRATSLSALELFMKIDGITVRVQFRDISF